MKKMNEIVKTSADEETMDRIMDALESAESNGFIGRYSSSLDELMDNSYEILEFAFEEEEIDAIPEKFIRAAFSEWMA